VARNPGHEAMSEQRGDHEEGVSLSALHERSDVLPSPRLGC
jgi:hypothetical protein